jgi:Ca2+-binding RTX toxin-like protein
MTAEQFNSATNGTVNATEAGTSEATLTLTDLANDETLTLNNVAGADVVLQVTDLVATSDMVLSDAGADTVALEASGVVDLTEATLGAHVDTVVIADGATLTMTAAQVLAIGFTDGDGDGVADAWSGTGMLNITEYNGEALDLDLLEAAGIDIGTITVKDASAATTVTWAGTLGGADEIVTPTAEDGNPEYGTESVTVQMTVAQFAGSAGIITGESVVNLTDLANNVDSDDDGQVPDLTEYDFSGIANAGTISFAADTNGDGAVDADDGVITLSETANFGEFTIVLADGELIRFATEGQAAADISVGAGITTGVQWLFTAITGSVDTSGYETGAGTITSLFIDEALLVANPIEEDLWTDLASGTVVEKVNGADIPELVKYDRVNTFQAFTNIGEGVNYNDSEEFSTVAELTMNLEGEVNLGTILLGDTNNGNDTTPNIDGQGYFTSLTINSYLDLSNNEGYDAGNPNVLPGRVIEVNTLGDITLNDGSVDELVDVTINTYGDDTVAATVTTADDQFNDAINVNSAAVGRDGLAIETGTITFAANEAKGAGEVTLTLTGDNDITIENIDISDDEVSALVVDASDMFLDEGVAGPTLTIGGVNVESYLASVDTITYIDGHTSPEAPATLDDFGAGGTNDLLIVAGGDNDLTEANTAEFEAVHVSADATLTMTYAQVANILITDGDADSVADNWTVADGVTVTLNIEDLPNSADLDLNLLEAAGFNIGTLSTAVDTDVELAATMTLGGADELNVQLSAGNHTLELTAEQYQQLNGGNITETDASDTVANTASVTIDGVEALEDATSGEVSLDLSTVLTTGTNTLQLGDGAGTAAVLLHDGSNGDNDVTFASAADLASFIINLYDATGTAAANELLGDTVRFNTAAQAERTITITNDGGTDAEQDTNVIWLFNDISGTASGTQIDTSGYGEALGRLWINDQLITDFSNDLEDLFIAGTDLDDNGNADDDINLNGSIIVRIVNTADLDALAAASSGVARKMEVEAYTDTSATGFVFNEEDQLVDVSDLTIDLGGATSLGDLTISNVVSTSNTIEDTDAFGTLTINSLLAASSTQNAYLLPEGFVDGTHTYPTAANVIGDIQTGAERNELTNVVLNTGDASGVGIGTDLIVGEIFFADDGDAADTGTVTLTVNGANNVTVESLDTSDAEVTALTIDNNLTSGGTLTVTGGSPAFDGGDIDDNTETLTINTGTAGNAQIQVVELSGSASADGTITFMGTEITVVDGDDANDVGTAIAAAVAAIQANNPSVAGIVNAAGTLTITMETNAGNVDTIVNATSNGVSFTDGESVEVQEVTVTGVATDTTINFMGTDVTVVVGDDATDMATAITAALADIQADNPTVANITNALGVLTVTFNASTENAGAIINADINGASFSDGAQAAASQLSTTPMTVFGSTDGATTYAGIASGELSELNIAETGSVDLGVIALVDSADFTLAVANADAYVTATLGEANVNGATVSPELDDGGTWVIDNVDELAIDGSTTFGAATLTITNSNVTVDTDVDWSELTALTMTGSTIVVAAGEELTITPALADGLTITGEGTVILVGDYDNGAAADYDLSNINVANIDASGITDTDLADDATDTVNTTGVTLDISGGAQDTALIGSNFNDTVTMDETDTIAAGTGTDTVTFNTAVTAAELEDADMSGVEVISVTADDATYDFSAQTEDLDITGDADDQFIIGGEGNDDIDGGAGADALSGGDGDDVLIADGNDLAIEGGDGDDTLEISADLNLQATAATVSFSSITQTMSRAVADDDEVSVTINGNPYAVTADIPGTHLDAAAVYAALETAIEAGEADVTVSVTDDAFTFTATAGAFVITTGLSNDNGGGTGAVTTETDGVSFSGVETVTATADGADLTLDYTQVGDLDEFNGFTTTGATVEQLNVVGSDDNDTIDLGAITLTDAIASIAAGDGNDVIVAEDTFVIDGGNNAATAVNVSLDDDSDSVTAGTTDNAPGGNDYDSFSFDDNLAVGDKFRITIGDDHYDYESDTVVESDAYAAIAALINADSSALVTATASATQVLLTEKLITGNIAVTVESLGDIVQFADDVTAANLADGDLTNVENIDITNTTDGTYDFSSQTEAALTITGSEQNDTIAMGSQMDSGIAIDGGAGNSDEIQFTDAGAVTDIDSVTNVEVITLGDATTAITLSHDLVVKEGETLTINGAALTAGQQLTLDTTAETDGNLIVTGGLDADTIDTGDGDDQVTGGEGIDTIDTGAGDDTLIGGIGDDILTGGAGNDTFEVTADNDTISDLENGDVIVVTGNAGATVAVVGDFFATADTSNDTLTGTVTLNLQTGQADFINMDAATGTEGYTINGSGSSDDITGSDFDDIIDGGADADEIRGGAGDDDLTGGAAADNFVYASATDGVDTYTDFVFNGTDTLELTIGTLHDIGGGGADSNVSTAVNAGATPAALAADAAAVAGTDLAVISGNSADMTVVSLASTQAIIEAAIEAELADTSDFSANITAAGEGTLLLIENDADNNGAADSYFLAIVASIDGNATTDAGEVTLLGIFEDADAANVAAGDLV